MENNESYSERENVCEKITKKILKKRQRERTESEKVTNYKGDPNSECFFIAPNSERE